MEPRGGTKMSDSFQAFTVLCQPSDRETTESHAAGTRAEWGKAQCESVGPGEVLTMDQRVDWDVSEAE